MDNVASSIRPALAKGNPSQTEWLLLNELYQQIQTRIGKLARLRERMFAANPDEVDASGRTHLLALAFGPSLIAPNLRERAGRQVDVANVGRLAAVVGIHGVMRVIDQIVSGGRGAPALDWLFAEARGDHLPPESEAEHVPADAILRAPGAPKSHAGEPPVGGPARTERPARPGEKVVFAAQQMQPLAVRRVVRAEVFEKTINVGPVGVDVNVVANAQVVGELTASVGAGTMTDANVDANGKGTAKLRVPTEVSGALDIGGDLEAQGRLLKVFPAAKVTARVDAQAHIAAKGETELDVAVSQNPDGELAFDARGLMGGELVGGLDLTAGLEVAALGKTLWSADWSLAARQWRTGTQVSGTWRAQVSPAGVKADMAVDESLLDANGLVDAAFAQANVTQQNGEDNPWKCRREGNDIVGDFNDFPWAGANGAPAYPSAPVEDHPANAFLGMVVGKAVPQPRGPYRIVPGLESNGGDGKANQWREKIAGERDYYKEDIKDAQPGITDNDAEISAKRAVEKDYGMDWRDLYLLKGRWDCHHIQEINWSGADLVSNLKYIEYTPHKTYTKWAGAHRREMQKALGIK